MLDSIRLFQYINSITKILFCGLLTILALSACLSSNAKTKRDYIPQAKLIASFNLLGAHSSLNNTGIVSIDGKIWTWGWRRKGQTGNNTIKDISDPPTMVTNLPQIIDIAGGVSSILTLDINGIVWGWGEQYFNEAGCYSGNMSSGYEYENAYVPCKVISNIKQLSTAEGFSIALDKNGDVWTWGDSRFGQLGRRVAVSGEPDPIPSRINFREKVRLIGNHQQGGFAITESNKVWVWGGNYDGVMGIAGVKYYIEPIRFYALESIANNITYIGGGWGWATALLDDGSVVGWGNTASLGKGIMYNTSPTEKIEYRNTKFTVIPEKININAKIDKLYARYRGIVALSSKGEIFTWGLTSPHAQYPQYIYGTVPTKQNTIGNHIVDIAVGREYIYYINEVGDLFGVGNNSHYQITTEGSKLVYWPGVQIHYQEFTP